MNHKTRRETHNLCVSKCNWNRQKLKLQGTVKFPNGQVSLTGLDAPLSVDRPTDRLANLLTDYRLMRFSHEPRLCSR